MDATLCLIVKNEAKQLRQCIDSFRGLYSDIIVVDTGSTDNTKTVAKKLGAAVFSFKWQNDFSKARNFALSKIKAPWIFMVDADDRINEQVKKKLKKELKNLKKNISIISCQYLYSSQDKKYGQTGYRPRFFKTSLKLKFIYPVHEYLQIPQQFQKNHLKLDLPFLHEKNSIDVKKGLKRNIDIMKKYIKKHPHDLRMLYYLVHDNFYLGNYKETIKWAEQYLNSNSKDSNTINKILNRQGFCYLRLNQVVPAIESFLMAMAAAPKLIEPYLNLGDIYMANKKYREAIQFYKMAKLCEYPKGTNQYYNTAAYEYYADISLSNALPKISDYKNALKHAKRAKKYLPNDKKLLNHIKFLESKV